MTVKSTKSGQSMKPLLTREHAEILYATNYDKWPQTRDPLDDLRKGRTACVRVMSEDEHKAKFQEWREAFRLNYSGEDVWLACARAMGAIVEDGK